MMMICHCSCIDCNKWPTVVQDVDSREGYMWRGLFRDIWDLPLLFAQFFCETKTSLKTKFTTKQTNNLQNFCDVIIFNNTFKHKSISLSIIRLLFDSICLFFHICHQWVWKITVILSNVSLFYFTGEQI